MLHENCFIDWNWTEDGCRSRSSQLSRRLASAVEDGLADGGEAIRPPRERRATRQKAAERGCLLDHVAFCRPRSVEKEQADDDVHRDVQVSAPLEMILISSLCFASFLDSNILPSTPT